MNDLFRFIGQDGSMQYRTGKVYLLELQGRGMFGDVAILAPVRCLYKNWETFLENWERV